MECLIRHLAYIIGCFTIGWWIGGIFHLFLNKKN